MYVDKAKAASNEAVSAYIDFYLEDLTEFVEGAGYVPLPEDQVAADPEDLGRPDRGHAGGGLMEARVARRRRDVGRPEPSSVVACFLRPEHLR